MFYFNSKEKINKSSYFQFCFKKGKVTELYYCED